MNDLLTSSLALLLALLPLRAAVDGDPRPAPAAPLEPAALERLAPGSRAFPIGAEGPPLVVPQGEELVFGVVIDLGPLGTPRVGKVSLASGVDAAEEPGSAEGAALALGWLAGRATGGYFGYRLDQKLRVTIRPEGWPRIAYADVLRGSGNRSREVSLGEQDGGTVSTYRRDGHCKGCERPEHLLRGRTRSGKGVHCAKCKLAEHRVWREPETRAVPPDTVDMLSAVYVARSMLREDRERATFHLIDRDELWEVALERGDARSMTVPAGTFAVREIRLIPRRPPDEELDEDERFEGLFGLKGSIRIWFHETTGVPVCVEGEVPAGPFELAVRVELERHRGTPPAFAPQ